MLTIFGSYFFLRLYVQLTHLFDISWKRLYQLFHSSLVLNVNKAVGLIISMTLLNCPKRTMIDECPNENVTFWLYNANIKEPYQMKENNISTLSNAPFNPGLPIKILVHGYTGHRNHDPNPQIRPHYITMGYNVISIDYEAVARKPCYFQAVDNTVTVGDCLGNFIDLLLTHNKKIYINMIHVVTFSLGAHVGVYAGVYLRSKKNIMLERLTVLDAAAPMFYMKGNFISAKCAKFIDAIHTNAGLYGKTGCVGHVDFYVNFLLFQRGCGVFDVSCNHLRAPLYFGESIKSNVGFWGYPLNESEPVQIMGEYTPSTASGLFYLSTNSASPYATGDSFPAAFRRIKAYFAKLLDVNSRSSISIGYHIYRIIEYVTDYLDEL